MSAKVSIIMPVKNVAKYIEDCIHSILNQSFEDWELIVVNDWSTDNTLELIQNFIASDDRIQCCPNEGHGIIPALQLALSKTHGEFITRFDGDDIMPTDRLAVMVKAMEASSPKTIVTGKVKYFSDHPISEGYQNYEHWLNERIDQNDHWDWVYRECVIASPNWMMRRKELIEIGGFNELNYPEDYDLVFRWYLNDFSVKGLNQVTLHWREHSERTSRNSTHYDQEHFFRLKMRHFAQNTNNESNLVLWGTDTKGKLAATILDELEIEFTWMDLPKSNRAQELMGHHILDYRMIEKTDNSKLLISVFPSEYQKLQLERYLNDLRLQHGQDYHYL